MQCKEALVCVSRASLLRPLLWAQGALFQSSKLLHAGPGPAANARQAPAAPAPTQAPAAPGTAGGRTSCPPAAAAAAHAPSAASSPQLTQLLQSQPKTSSGAPAASGPAAAVLPQAGGLAAQPRPPQPTQAPRPHIPWPPPHFSRTSRVGMTRLVFCQWAIALPMPTPAARAAAAAQAPEASARHPAPPLPRHACGHLSNPLQQGPGLRLRAPPAPAPPRLFTAAPAPCRDCRMPDTCPPTNCAAPTQDPPPPPPGVILMPASIMAISTPASALLSMSSSMLPRCPMRNTCTPPPRGTQRRL